MLPSSTNPTTANSSFTPTGARRSGDDYQDIIALQYMVEWLENPRRYERMVVEDDDSENKFLDDVRLDRSDGTLVVRQVKFSVHPEAPDDAWTWESLLDQRLGKERRDGTRPELPSLLQKWGRTWTQLTTSSDGSLPPQVDAAVVSNRRTAPDLKASLNERSHVDFDRIAASDIKTEIVRQLGDEAAARAFFDGFRFELEHPSYEALAEGLLRRLKVLGGDVDGWNNLQVELRGWVRHRELPPPNGDITLLEIRRAVRWYSLQSLPQEFVIPPDYVLPDLEFHRHLREELLTLDGECRVLTASPGAGKSTYCSALYEELHKSGIPVVRHHYFLSLSDPRAIYSAFERLDHRRAAESLMHDLIWEHGEALSDSENRNPNPQDLRLWLTECGEYYARQGKKLIVILDGLDHIWREAGSIEELRRLLDYLLPVPPGVVVLMATQPVEDAKLPNALLSNAPRAKWFKLPFLHLNSIRQWLLHHKAEIWPDANVDEYQLSRLADKFYEKSKGHPLHLRYSLKALQERAVPVTEWNVEELPACPHENITEYYNQLELRLTDEGRQILHLMATSRFQWPRQGLFNCLASSPLDQPRIMRALRDVEHLLVNDDLGLRAFHGSLLVWLQSRPDHKIYAETLRAATIVWLSSLAPEAWRWAYEWMLKADDGNSSPLLNGPNRDWAIEAVAQRREGRDVHSILARAGWCALEANDVPRALELGLLSDYTHNTYDYYDHLLESLLLPQLIVEEDPYLRPRLSAAQAECTDLELASLAEAEWRLKNPERVRELFNELVHRLETNRSRSNKGESVRFEDSSDAISRVAALLPVADTATALGKGDVERILRWALRNRRYSSGYGASQITQSVRLLSHYAHNMRAFGNAPALRRAVQLTTLADPDEIGGAIDDEDSEQSEAEEKAGTAKSTPFDLRMYSKERECLLYNAVWLALEKELNFSDIFVSDLNNIWVCLYFLARGEKQTDQSTILSDFEWPNADLLTLSESRSMDARRDVGSLFYETFFAFLVNAWSGQDEENKKRLSDLETQVGIEAWALRFLKRLHFTAHALVARIAEKTPTSFVWFFEQLRSLSLPYYVGYIRGDEGHYGISARLAAGRIGQSLWALLRALGLRATPLLPLDEFYQATHSDYLQTEVWLSETNESRVPVFSPEDANRYLRDERDKLDSQVTELNERTEAWTKLATFAALHGVNDEAQVLIRRAAGCMVAHYWHKENSLFTLLDSIRTLYGAFEANAAEIGAFADEGRETLRECVLQVARVIAQVGNFTDGDETGHLPEELAETLQAVAPKWLPDYFVECQELEDHNTANAAFNCWLTKADLNDPVQAAVASTALSTANLEVLQTRAKAGDAMAQTVLTRTLEFCGEEALNPRFERGSNSTSSPPSERTPPSPADYPPSGIEEYFAELERRGFYIPLGEVDEWIEFWGEREADQAIPALESALERRRTRVGGWDGLFTTALHKYGREDAYTYLVKAHREAASWQFYYSDRNNSRARWQRVREFYPDKWFEFLLDTTRGENVPWEGSTFQRVSLGYSTWAHLTEFFAVQEQFALALSCVKAMTQYALMAASPVPLAEPKWVARVRLVDAETSHDEGAV